MIKALREAKVHTSWLSPDDEYEAAGHAIRRVDPRSTPGDRVPPVVRSVPEPNRGARDLQQPRAAARSRSTAPGVPDFYQGTELWDFSLVDPDNRRPVDYRARAELLEGLRARADAPDAIDELFEHRADGR